MTIDAGPRALARWETEGGRIAYEGANEREPADLPASMKNPGRVFESPEAVEPSIHFDAAEKRDALIRLVP
jgi:hypothetical protein